jgi:ATP-dependent HslUV protease subunit HslV
VLLVADNDHIYELTGNGDVLEPEMAVMGVGSGGTYAQGNNDLWSFVGYGLLMMLFARTAAAMALMDVEGMDAETIVRKGMKIAGDMCVYTNHNLLVEQL